MSSSSRMYVVKRDGRTEPVHFDKITGRIKGLCFGLSEYVDPVAVSQKVCLGVYKGVTTSELDELAAETAAHMSSQHPDYGLLAARIAVSNLHKNTKKCFSDVMTDLCTYVHPKTNEPAPLLSKQVYDFIMANKDRLNSAIVHKRDDDYDYFGFKTLERSYLLRLKGKVAERPQQMLMRVACGIHTDDIEAAIETYELLSCRWFTHASPTLFNSGTPLPQNSSCFLLTMAGDSIEQIFDTLKQCALISKHAGGIGLSVSNIRATGSYIRGTNGTSNGLVPMLRVFNNTARYVDQCFPGATPIRTEHGLRPIEAVKAGDRVYTHTGKLRAVTKVLDYQASETGQTLFRVECANGKALHVTGAHPFLCLKNQPADCSPERVRARLAARLTEFTWEDAQDLDPATDWLLTPSLKDTPLEDGEVELGGQRLVRLAKVSEAGAAEGRLYDLEVEGDHSYVTECGAVHNGGGKRKGSFAIYLEPWHADVSAFLQLKKNQGADEYRARDLFQALWVPDLFMKRVEENKEWSLFCPNEAPGLIDVWGEEFNALYERYEKEKRARKVVKARSLWQEIMEVQIETGQPYMLYKDSCNGKSNQKNLGTIRSSNLCTEIVEFSSPDEIAVCNLASIGLPMFVSQGAFDHKKLFEVTRVITRNLNKIIDTNHYPVPEAKRSNLRHRPIGIGVQGLADTFALMRLPWESDGGRTLNRDIFETIYFAALTASCELSEKHGPYETYKGSPISQGIFQFDMWGVKPSSRRWDWDALRARILKHGVRNSLLVAPMPTASTSQILGNNESFEPWSSNIYVRRTLAGEFVCVNRFLLNDLVKRGLWNAKVRNMLIAHDGSVQKIPEIPDDLKAIYKTASEIPLRVQIDFAADRGAFIDQSQSFNVNITDPSTEKLTKMHFYGWKKGLKTGMYYLRSHAAADPIKFTVDAKLLRESAQSSTTATAPPISVNANPSKPDFKQDFKEFNDFKDFKAAVPRSGGDFFAPHEFRPRPSLTVEVPPLPVSSSSLHDSPQVSPLASPATGGYFEPADSPTPTPTATDNGSGPSAPSGALAIAPPPKATAAEAQPSAEVVGCRRRRGGVFNPDDNDACTSCGS